LSFGGCAATRNGRKTNIVEQVRKKASGWRAKVDCRKADAVCASDPRRRLPPELLPAVMIRVIPAPRNGYEERFSSLGAG
jgi:hypothetical protein